MGSVDTSVEWRMYFRFRQTCYNGSFWLNAGSLQEIGFSKTGLRVVPADY
jgi:hypothetical protein